jgi:hypothetical protein
LFPSQKRHFFCQIFMRKFFKNHNIGPKSRCYYHNFRRKKWRFSLKPILRSGFLQRLAVFCTKNANFFVNFFRDNKPCLTGNCS